MAMRASIDLLQASHSMIQEDVKASLRTKITLKADSLKEINSKKIEVQAELERIKLEIKELNMKHKES